MVQPMPLCAHQRQPGPVRRLVLAGRSLLHRRLRGAGRAHRAGIGVVQAAPFARRHCLDYFGQAPGRLVLVVAVKAKLPQQVVEQDACFWVLPQDRAQAAKGVGTVPAQNRLARRQRAGVVPAKQRLGQRVDIPCVHLLELL